MPPAYFLDACGTEKQVDAMFAAIEEELTTARAAFKKGKDSRKFKF